MSNRVGIRRPNGKIASRPSLDVQGNSYTWNNVSVVPLTKTTFYVVPVGFKMTSELEAELLNESAQLGAPTPEQLTGAALPQETPEPRTTRRKPDTKDS